MTQGASARRRYAGRGVRELRGGAARGVLPDPDEATLLPNPMQAHEDLLAHFHGGTAGKGGLDSLAEKDLKAFANFMTFALRNDLPTIDVYDAAVIWEKWRLAVAELHQLFREARNDRSDGDSTRHIAMALEHRAWDVRESLATALSRPGEVADRYCPWKADFFTYERLHPEAV